MNQPRFGCKLKRGFLYILILNQQYNNDLTICANDIFQ